ncbi:MAG: aspartate carbamoyltransferase catalytic subunit [Clostridia bacterium]|nr:aspartate carbamoyltransferase catalytic subunit [Clostridia bacterium]
MDKDLLGLRNMAKEDIEEILDGAKHMKKLLKQGVKKLPNLQGKSVITLFYENSTRTRVSFELASKYMSAVAVNISASASSVSKGETLIDTGKTLDAMQSDVIIIRHPMSGAPSLLAKNVRASIINAGDGTNEHPTQALLDMFTMMEKYGTLKGLKVAILGDIKHSRVAKSNIFGLTKLGAEAVLYSPATMMLPEVERLGGIRAKSREEALSGADVVMGLRIQLERQQGGLFPSLAEYSEFYGVGERELALAKPGAMIMHPGPVNRGVELSSKAIDADNSFIEEQVLSGVAVRMAILSLLTRK